MSGRQGLSLVTVVVEDYDAAIAFYVGTLGFELIEDTDQPEQDKRWVVVRPGGGPGRMCCWPARRRRRNWRRWARRRGGASRSS